MHTLYEKCRNQGLALCVFESAKKVAIKNMTNEVRDQAKDGGIGSYSVMCAHGKGQCNLGGLRLFARDHLG